jgi:hypothetical protein
MSTVEDVVAGTKNPRTGSIRSDRTEIRLLTLCPKVRLLDKRIKVIEPNVSVPGHVLR